MVKSNATCVQKCALSLHDNFMASRINLVGPNGEKLHMLDLSWKLKRSYHGRYRQRTGNFWGSAFAASILTTFVIEVRERRKFVGDFFKKTEPYRSKSRCQEFNGPKKYKISDLHTITNHTRADLVSAKPMAQTISQYLKRFGIYAQKRGQITLFSTSTAHKGVKYVFCTRETYPIRKIRKRRSRRWEYVLRFQCALGTMHGVEWPFK